MVTFVLLEEQIHMRAEWRSATMDSGELSAITYGIEQMLGWPVDSLAIQEFVGFTSVYFTLFIDWII